MWVVETNETYYVFTEQKSALQKSEALTILNINNTMYFSATGRLPKVIKIRL